MPTRSKQLLWPKASRQRNAIEIPARFLFEERVPGAIRRGKGDIGRHDLRARNFHQFRGRFYAAPRKGRKHGAMPEPEDAGYSFPIQRTQTHPEESAIQRPMNQTTIAKRNARASAAMLSDHESVINPADVPLFIRRLIGAAARFVTW